MVSAVARAKPVSVSVSCGFPGTHVKYVAKTPEGEPWCVICALNHVDLEREALINLLTSRTPGMEAIRKALLAVARSHDNLVAQRVLNEL